jgi:hypothetical protein
MRLLAFLLVLLAATPARAEKQLEFALRALRTDPSLKVRTQAAIVLGQRGAEDAIPALREAAANDDAPAVRVAAVSALARIGAPSARAAIEAARRDPDASVRAAVERALADGTGRQRAARALAFFVEDASGDAGGREARTALRDAIERHLKDRGHAIVTGGGAYVLKPSVVEVAVSSTGSETVIAVKASLVAVDGAGRMELLEGGAKLRTTGPVPGTAVSRYAARALDAAARTLCDDLSARLQ